jgi:DNA-directed RNA polymerase subunit RPC12/RpoP
MICPSCGESINHLYDKNDHDEQECFCGECGEEILIRYDETSGVFSPLVYKIEDDDDSVAACPFCGMDGELITDETGTYVLCNNCGIDGEYNDD